MVGLERLGFHTAYAGRFGSDEAGKFVLQSLAEEGVDISYAEQAECPTQVGFIVIDESTGERTVLWHRDDRLAYSAADAPLAMVRRARILHMTGHDTAACIAMAREAKKTGVVVSADIDYAFDGIDELLPLVDLLTVANAFLEKLTGSDNAKQALSDIVSKYGSKVAGVTLGKSGSLFFIGFAFFETPRIDFPRGCTDTTGAGDAFRSGLLYGLLSNESIENSTRMANAVAALKCRGVGARSSLPNKRELTELMNQE
jgi:sugar/nucleoside kinase (ribokinase family)